MNIITATNYNGRLHLGIGDDQNAPKAMGSINVYRNPIAKFFTKIFGFSMDVVIDGKSRTLNVKSLNNHLNSIELNFPNDQLLKEIKKVGYEAFINNNAHQIKHSGKILGDDFSEDKKIKLLEKLISKIQVNDVEAAKKIVRKGAPLEREVFLVRHDQKQTILHNMKDVILKTKEIDNSSIYSITPLSFAVLNNNESIANFISNYKKNDLSKDRYQIINSTSEEAFEEDHRYYKIFGHIIIWAYTRIDVVTKNVYKVISENNKLLLKDITEESRKASADFMWSAKYRINARIWLRV